MSVRLIALGFAALLLAACDNLPASGPTALEIQNSANPEFPEPTDPGFTLIKMTDEIAAKLEAWPSESFADVFPEPGGGASDRIATGDIVTVTIWESVAGAGAGGLFRPASPTSSTGAAPVTIPPQVVDRNGTITVPFAGQVRVRGRTTKRVERAIVELLEGKAINPQAIVTSQKTASNMVSIIGDAASGGAIPLAPGAERLADVIAASGGITTPIDRTLVTLTRGDKVATQPLSQILADPSQNLKLSPGDLITVSETINFFTAIGATGINTRRDFGLAPFFLSDALGQVGGVLDSRGDPAGVYVMRLEDPAFAETAFSASGDLSPETPIAYHFNFDEAETFFLARRFAMQDRDIIFIANAPTVEIQKLLDIFRSAAATAQTVDRTNTF